MNATTKIIDLAELRDADAFPGYVAIHGHRTDNPFVLSPDVMRWSDNIHICRLDACKAFWLGQKKKLSGKLSELFAPILRQHCGEDYVAVFGEHPWQCLLFLHYQLRQQACGIYLLQSRLGQNLFRSLDWDCWFGAQDALLEQLVAIRARGFNPETFRAKQAQFMRFIERVGVVNPHAMSAADANAITRRYGTWMGRIWRWTFNDEPALEWFPWNRYKSLPHPLIRRDLEYPVSEWACIEVLLREDFASLCEQFSRDDCEHVNQMQWQITLFNYQKIEVELSFRHPYSLHRDLPAFNTALYQARYVYQDLMRQLRARESDLDLPESMPFIAWQVEVCERITLSPEIWDLFASDYAEVDYQQVMTLQNKLPIAFESYQSFPSFFPEHSFSPTPLGTRCDQSFDDLQWTHSAQNKPLFYYPEALPFEPVGKLQKIFLERNSKQWWLSEDALQSIRDYFILKDQRGRSSWAYRDADGSWFKAGEYC